jgi:hypothetical protein
MTPTKFFNLSFCILADFLFLIFGKYKYSLRFPPSDKHIFLCRFIKTPKTIYSSQNLTKILWTINLRRSDADSYVPNVILIVYILLLESFISRVPHLFLTWIVQAIRKIFPLILYFTVRHGIDDCWTEFFDKD